MVKWFQRVGGYNEKGVSGEGTLGDMARSSRSGHIYHIYSERNLQNYYNPDPKEPLIEPDIIR